MRRTHVRLLQRSSFTFTILALLALASTQSMWAKGTLLVKCVKESGETLQGIKVLAQLMPAPKIKDEKTNKEGVAEFKKLDDGFYRIMARQDGYAPALYEYAEVADNSEKSITLTMKPGDATAKLYFEDPAMIQQATTLAQEGQQLLQQSKWADAQAKLEAALAIQPTHLLARYQLGVALLSQQKWDEGKTQVEKVMELLPAFLKIQENQPQQVAQLQQMQTGCQQVLDQLPTIRLQSEAEAAIQAGRYDEGIEKLKALLKDHPDNFGGFYNLAMAYARSKQYDEAETAIDTALKLKPDDKNAQQVKQWLVSKKKADANQQLQDVLKEGQALLKEGKYQEALDKYEQVHKATTKPIPGLMIDEARIYAKLNQPDKAIEAYQEGIKEAPEKQAAYTKELAEFYFQQKQYEKGLQTFTEVFQQTNTPVDQGMFDLGQAHLKKNEKVLAKLLFEEVVKNNPNFAEAYYELGILYFYEDQDKAKAKEALTKYIGLSKDPSHTENAKALLVVVSR